MAHHEIAAMYADAVFWIQSLAVIFHSDTVHDVQSIRGVGVAGGGV